MMVNWMLYDICWTLLPSPSTIALFAILLDISYVCEGRSYVGIHGCVRATHKVHTINTNSSHGKR